MSDEQATAEAPAEHSSGDVDPIRQAARELVERRGGRDDSEPTEPVVALKDRVDSDGFNRGVSPRDAAAELTKFRESEAEKKRALDAALGIDSGDPEQPQQDKPAEIEAEPAQKDDPPAPEPAQQEVERIKQKAQSEIARARDYQENLRKMGHLHAQHAALEQQFTTAFPEIKSAQDIQHLLNTNAPRGYAALEYLVHADAVIKQAQLQAHETHRAEEAHYQSQYSTWAMDQDKAFEQRHPELKDPKVAREVGEMALRELEALGLTRAELTNLYQGRASVSLRDHRAQEIILDAARWRHAQRSGRLRPSPKPAPHVLKPGVSRPIRSEADSELAGITAAAKEAPTVRNMARLLAARRRAAAER